MGGVPPGGPERYDDDQPRIHIPRSTYRLQFGESFTFTDARAIVPYLSALGISDVYASPFLRARGSSTHGYDVVDHGSIDPRIGTYEDLQLLAGDLKARGMGLIADVVPNHMGVGEGNNLWWIDVLEFGEASPYAPYFDIDWQTEHRVLLPILEDQYGTVLESGTILLEHDGDAFVLRYHDRILPLAPCTYAQILDLALADLEVRAPDHGEVVTELSAIAGALRALPSHDDPDVERRMASREWAHDLKTRLASLISRSSDVDRACTEALRLIEGHVGEPSSFDALDRLLNAQPYRLASWRVAADEINYRRFFDINELVAIRTELPEVFADTHRLVLDMVRDGIVTGLRIDHPDGLLRPAEYLHRLQDACQRPDATPSTHAIYVVIEKILARGESIDRSWPIDGTTGYDFLADVNALYIERKVRAAFDRIYGTFTGQTMPFREIVIAMKKLIMLISFAGEVQALGRELHNIASRNRYYRDFTLNSLNFALREVIAALRVYRSYVLPLHASPHDLAVVAEAVQEARRRNPRTAASVFDFVGATLTLQNIETFAPADREGVRDLALRVQQVTGPVMAKGVEDTAFYIYNRLVSLNEVGSDPDRFGISVAAFHQANRARAADWPRSMITTSTHDTKRSEDARARLNVVTEVPSEWRSAVLRWSAMNEGARSSRPGSATEPDRNDEYLLYQALIAVWPSDLSDLPAVTERISAYMRKAVREAKTHTSWIEPNEAYEEATERFVRDILSTGQLFVADVDAFVRQIAPAGYINSLSQTLIKLAAPGVPDFYQGSEVWDFSLTDPDNRRPVDFALRERLLQTLEHVELEPLWHTRADGRLKMLLIHRALSARNKYPDLFKDGGYTSLRTSGPQSRRIVAFARQHKGEWAIAIAPRFVAPLCRNDEFPVGHVWDGVRVAVPDWAPARWTDALSGASFDTAPSSGRRAILVSEAFRHLPVALLIGHQ